MSIVCASLVLVFALSPTVCASLHPYVLKKRATINPLSRDINLNLTLVIWARLCTRFHCSFEDSRNNFSQVLGFPWSLTQCLIRIYFVRVKNKDHDYLMSFSHELNFTYILYWHVSCLCSCLRPQLVFFASPRPPWWHNNRTPNFYNTINKIYNFFIYNNRINNYFYSNIYFYYIKYN